MIQWFNNALHAQADAFTASHPDAVIIIFDVNEVLNRVLDSPGPFGFTNTTAFCPGFGQPDVLTDLGRYGCRPLREYFWYDDLHVNWRTHEVLAVFLKEFFWGNEFLDVHQAVNVRECVTMQEIRQRMIVKANKMTKLATKVGDENIDWPLIYRCTRSEI